MNWNSFQLSKKMIDESWRKYSGFWYLIAIIIKKQLLIKNKIYILPDYKCNHVKTTVSDLKEKDFDKAYKNNSIWLWIAGITFLGFIVAMIRGIKRKK